jgi:hypothetical protein
MYLYRHLMSHNLDTGKRKKVNSESGHVFSHSTVTGTGIQATEEAGNTSGVGEVIGGPGEN